eukprot:6177614-Amphidinium_carterae.1
MEGGCRPCGVTCLPGQQPLEQLQARMSQSERLWNPYLWNAAQRTQSFDQSASVRLRFAWSSHPT